MASTRVSFLVHVSPVTEHLDGFCEQCVINCLMVTYTHCVPGTGVLSMAHRGSDHTSTMLDWADKQAGLWGWS